MYSQKTKLDVERSIHGGMLEGSAGSSFFEGERGKILGLPIQKVEA